MRIKRPASALFLVTAGSFAAALIVAGCFALRSSAAAPTTVGIDFNTADNSATSVGAITTCLEVASGGSYTLDVYVQNVPGDTNSFTPDGMVAGQYTLNSTAGNTDTARTATGGFIDLGIGIGSPGTAAVDNTASTPVNNSTGADTIIASNDPAIGVSGAEGDGFFVRMTYTAPIVGTATIVPLTLTAVTLVDALANEIPVGLIKGATLIVAADGTTNCATLPTPTPPGQTPTPTPTPSATPTATPPGQTPTPTPTPSATPTATQPGQTPAPLTVVNNNDNGAGSLRQAIADAAPGDTIDFNAGLSGQTITLTTGELLISKDLTITGPAGGIAISGNNASRVFEISSGNVSMSDLTVTGGKSVSQGFQGWGGGILNNDRLALTNSTVSGNSADFGGGIFIGGSLTLTNSRVSSNNSDNSGGGIYLYYGGMTVTNSTIDGNTGGAFGAGGGGGILSRGATTLTDSTVSHNTGDQGGGGIVNDNSGGGGTLTLTNSTVSDNLAKGSDGGGISNYGVGGLTLTNSKVSANVAARFGGGIFSESSYITTITNSAIDSNRSGASGGGIASENAMTLTNSTVSRNTSLLRDGGGIYNHNGYRGLLTLINSTVSDNSAPQGSGSGIYNYNGPLTLINSTVSDNSVPQGSASGINNDQGTLTLTNSIVANRGGGDCFNQFGGTTISHGYNLDGDGTCNLTATGDLPGTNPMLDPLALNPPGTTETQALQLGSPAIDHIPTSVNGCGTTVSTDQRGVSRPQGSGCDIGAYELLNTAAFSVTKVYTNGNTTAFVTIHLACTSGMITDNDRGVTGGGTLIFHVSGDAPPDGCTATETSVPVGYTSDSPCSDTITGAPSGSGSCTITNTQNTAAFTVTKAYSDGNTTAVVSISLTCANGTVTDSPQSLTGGGSVTFNVSGDTPPDSCTATETSVPAGYTSDSLCSDTITGVPNGSGSCTITNTLNTAAFTVTKVYSDGNTAAVVSISLLCANGTVTDSPQSVTGGGSVTFNVSGDAPPDSCTASDSGVPASYTSDSPCSGTITGAPSGSGSCTITNTLNTATFKVTKVFSDGNTFTTVSIGLTCANSTVTDSPQSLTGSGSVTFHINGDTPPDTCTAAETVPTGYTGSGSPAGTCSGTITDAPSGSGFCAITNTPTGRHDVGVAGHGLGFNAPNTVKVGHTAAIHIRLENYGSVTETQIGYRVVATCSGTCTGTVTLSAACTGTVGPVAPGVTFVVEDSCTATPTTTGDVWLLTLMVIHCGADGVFAGSPCTTNDGAIDVNNANNVAVTKIVVT